LNYARPARASISPVDVGKVVARTAKILEAERPRCALTTRVSHDLPKVGVDAEQLRQVLSNLIWTAVQAMSGQGGVIICAQVSAAGRQDRGASHAPEWVTITVSDRRPGISTEVRQDLFFP